MTDIIRWEQDADGIVTLTIDDPNQRANTMNDDFSESLAKTTARLVAEKDKIAGVIITSAKDTFFAGGDLRKLIAVTDADAPKLAAELASYHAHFRAIETLGKPVVAALNGTALGGGLELSLIAHRRIALNNSKAQFGLPEVTLGLLPGAGGVVRITRLLGLADGLMKVLLQGTKYRVKDALQLGLIDEIAETPEELIAKSKAWIKANPESVQRWDVKGYKIPGGTPNTPALAANLPAFPANLRKQLKGAPLPAPHHILSAAVESALLDIESALKVEARYFVDLARGQIAKNFIQAFWFDLNAINAGGSRPKGFDKRQAKKVAVIGAGMMGAGITYVSANAGLEVVLKDVSLEAAEKGKSYSTKLLEKQVQRGKLTQHQADEILARIKPTADYKDLAGADLVVEAVFEKASLKHEVFGDVEKVVVQDALLGSNTSTLPITLLAEGVQRKPDFIGLHFFSPVDKMPLIEIIRGKQTSDEALARALDFAAQIKKTPIVVNDSRGFFTSRVIGTFTNEAIAMLGEGVAPSTIEQATTQAGYPVGALQLSDELNLELFVKIRNEARDAAGASYVPHPAEAVIDKMVELKRPGKLRGAGFFDYDESGKRIGLWKGLATEFPVKGDQASVDFKELQERMLIIEAVETARCVEEGVIVQTADANIGSIFGIGYPAWTGGVLQYINGYPGSIKAFVARADELAKKHGARFTPNALLRAKAEKNEKF